MSHWYYEVVKDIAVLPNALKYFNKELEDAAKEISLKGVIVKAAASLPGLLEYRFRQLQEVEAILEHFNILLAKERSAKIRKYMETYNRSLTIREVESWIEADDEVFAYKLLVNEIAHVRNQYLAIMKGFDAQSFQINNITKLMVASMDDAVFT